MSEQFSIRVGKEELCFSACHFLVFSQESVEPLHGHTYRVAVELAGPLNPDGMVADFTWVRASLRNLLQELDHRILLAGQDARLQIMQTAEEIELCVGTRRWIFPRSDCFILPVAATTTELLAQYLAHRFLEVCRAELNWLPDRLQIELEESPGLSAFVTCQPNEGRSELFRNRGMASF
ncbi:MAG: 6-carboxytetrahydropterin synthase [Thermoguttaceae bacterium]|nr:6-carboxytetrahydropterin synthase [Thermoguttaceae bacterium]MDW8037115.1 6-carboxytetrahydropterin synthase [Thermoguttaceae bacterium]